MKILFNLFFALFFITIAAAGQGFDARAVYDTLGSKARNEIGAQAIYDLKNGVLIFRLKTGNNKMQALEKVANSKSISPAEKNRFENKIEELKKEINNENDWLRESLKENYSFSKILYMPDTAAHLLSAGKQAGFFYNEYLEIDPAISLGGKPYLIAFYGPTSRATKSGKEGIVVLDQDFKELVEPFPHYTGLTTVRKLFDRMFNKKEEIYFFNKMAKRFNERLNNFYELNN